MKLDDALIDAQDSAWARFLGTHLPARTLDLRFDLLQPHRRGTRPELKPPRVCELYAGVRANRRAALAAVLEHGRALNRYRLAPPARCELAEIGLAAAMAAARDLVADVLKGRGGVPEEPGHGEVLESIATTLQTLVTAYQLVFQADYDKGRFWYARARRRVHHCAHRILELIGLIQQVRALRYQRLEGAHWRTANTVFRVMLEFEQVEVPLDSIGALLAPRRGRDPRSLQDLYAALQVPWILDFLSWPETLFQFVLDYCRAIQDGVQFFPGEGHHCGAFQALTQCYQDRQPDQQAGAQMAGPALLIDYSILVTQAQADFEEVRKARTARNPYLLPRRFSLLDPPLQLAAGHLMARLCEQRPPPPWSPPGRGAADLDLRIHASFQEVYEHLLAVFDPRGQLAARRELSDLFAQRSATIGEDHTADQASLWHVLQEAPGSLRLQTQETRFTHRMAIGSFLAYGVGETGIRRPHLGKVTRIHRPDRGLVQVDLLAFADYARPLGVHAGPPAASTNGTRTQDTAVRALFAYADDCGWQLLLPNSEQFWENANVSLVGGGKEIGIELGELRDLGENYCLFRLKARQGQGERPQYPMPAPSAAPAAAPPAAPPARRQASA